MTDFHEPPPVNPYDSPETVRPGMSSGAKVLIGLGIGCGVLVLLCCGVFGVSMYFFGRSFNMSEDPATVRRVLRQLEQEVTMVFTSIASSCAFLRLNTLMRNGSAR